MIKDFLKRIEEELNEEQRRAVCYDKGFVGDSRSRVGQDTGINL